MIKINELPVIAEADVALSFKSICKEGVLEYGMNDYIQTPLGRIRISMDMIRLNEVACSYHDLDIWYPSLYFDDCLPQPWGRPGDPKPDAIFFVGSRPKSRKFRKSVIYRAEESENTYNEVRYKWVWVIPVRYYDATSDSYVNDSHIAVLVADLRFGLPEYNNPAVPVLHLKLYEPVPIDSLRDTDS
jgi:hypothetical protein